MECDGEMFSSFWTVFCPNNPKNQNFEKMKKCLETLSFYTCVRTIYDNHIIYGSWDVEHEQTRFFVILDFLLPFYSSNKPKNQNFEKMKKNPRDNIILQKCTKNNGHMLYCSFTPLTTRKIKIFKKNLKNAWR